MRKADGAFELVGCTKTRLDQAERDRMDLKMEVAHLRERLLQRMGGDTTAQELEEESFIMKKELVQMEQSLVEHREMLLIANAKHDKALTNLQKMDAAWKASVNRIQILQAELESRDKQLAEVDMLKKILRDQEFAIQTLDGENKQLRRQDTAKDTSILELEGTIRRMQVEFEEVNHQLTTKAGMSKDAQREAEGELQVMVEKSARLQGEVNALHEEMRSVNARSREVESASTLLKSKLLQLTEEHATLQIHMAASKTEIERHVSETTFLKAEITRLQAELNAKDHELLQHQKVHLDAESTILDTKKKIQLDQQMRELQTRRMELDVEKKCRDQAHEYELRLQRQDTILEDTKHQLRSVEALHTELVQLLGVDDPTNLREKVVAVLQELAQVHDRVEKQRHKLAVAEKAGSDHQKLQYAYTELEEKYNKTRLAMERIVNRKTKVGGAATPSLSAPPLLPIATTATVHASPALHPSPETSHVDDVTQPGSNLTPALLKENTPTLPSAVPTGHPHLSIKPAPSFTLKRKVPSFSTTRTSAKLGPGLAELRTRVAAQPPIKHTVVKSRYMQPPKYL